MTILETIAARKAAKARAELAWVVTACFAALSAGVAILKFVA